VIDIVERLAPDGFAHIDDVIDPRELEAVVAGYTAASGVTRALRTGRIGTGAQSPTG
jgi:5-methylphenazine-1-carboxylate 1-monooxygenase